MFGQHLLINFNWICFQTKVSINTYDRWFCINRAKSQYIFIRSSGAESAYEQQATQHYPASFGSRTFSSIYCLTGKFLEFSYNFLTVEGAHVR